MNKDSITSLDMARLELNSEYLGISPQLLMENAGRVVANEIESRFKNKSKIMIFGGMRSKPSCCTKYGFKTV